MLLQKQPRLEKCRVRVFRDPFPSSPTSRAGAHYSMSRLRSVSNPAGSKLGKYASNTLLLADAYKKNIVSENRENTFVGE
jgi:hypothetical protein